MGWRSQSIFHVAEKLEYVEPVEARVPCGVGCIEEGGVGGVVFVTLIS